MLQKAMLLFWRQGYESVSTRALAETMGINQFSLYASFGSKEELFERALARYLQVIFFDWMAQPLDKPNAGKHALREFFETFVQPGDGNYPASCLICNTMAMQPRLTHPAQQIIDQYLDEITNRFSSIMRQDFPGDTDEETEAKASMLSCLLLGIALRKRNGFEGRPVQLLVDKIISSIYQEGECND